jgi:hypothetical protein
MLRNWIRTSKDDVEENGYLTGLLQNLRLPGKKVKQDKRTN